VIELSADRPKARFDVAETLAVRQQCERHREILIPTGQILQIATTAVAGYALLKLLVGKELDQLREYGAPRIHPALSPLRRSLPRMLLTLFALQIVLTPKRMHHTESTTLVLSLKKFPRTAVVSEVKFQGKLNFALVVLTVASGGYLSKRGRVCVVE